MFGARVKIALEEKGVSYEEKMEDLPNKTQLLLGMNPVHKRVPVLIHNGKPICESLIIIEYIDQVWNDRAPFLPNDPYAKAQDPFAKAQARFWADFVDQKFYNTHNKIIWNKSKEEVEEGTKELGEILKVLEGALGGNTYFGGDTFGFVDIALIGFQVWFHAYETRGKFSIEAEYPKIDAWTKRCLEKETVCKSLGDPNKVYDLVMSFRKKFELDS
ncbi:probable glutathione s-transferase parc [Phtheirospermum japonicum]|uniref:glutathione transferase n=1 Tax=Phtheirospermum japonicum TaxID=374723 RepID=A0A830B0H9_9LAMI|nr:probable glutathione s-transferase parc [Phtheirospermum japonicum]